MSKDNALILKNSGILFLRLLVTSFIGLFSSRLIIRSLGASDFGLYSVVGGVVIMMAFLNTVMTSTSYRFIAYEMGKGNNDDINRVFNLSLVIHLCLGLLLLVFTETVGVYYIRHYLIITPGKLADALFVLRFSTYATIFSIVSIPYMGLVTAQEKFAKQAVIEITRSFLALIVAVTILYFAGNRLRLYSLLIAIVNIVPAFMFYAYCRQKFRAIIKWNFQRGINKYKEMLSFSSWVMIGAASSIGRTTGSALIINLFFGTVLNAAYGIANQVNSVVLMFAQNLGQAAIPQITKSFSSGNTNRTLTLVAYISKYSFFLMLLPALPILLETNYLLTIWLGDLPPYTVIFCQLMIINALIDSLGYGIPAAVNATGKIKYYQIILAGTSLLSLPISFVLYKFGFPPPTILVTILFIACLNFVIRQFVVKKIIPSFSIIFLLNTSYIKILYVILLISPLFFLHELLIAGFSRFFFFSLFSVCWLLVAIYLVGTEKREKVAINQILKKVINTKKFFT